MPLDMLVTGGRIATLAGDAGFGWVEAVGITDGRVAFAGFGDRASRPGPIRSPAGSSSIPTRSRSRA